MSLKHLVRTPKEIKLMRESGRMLASTLSVIKESIQPGITTGEIDEIARKHIKSLGGKPAFYGYQGFPAAVCASVNEQVVHGIPGDYELKKGDIASFDCGVNYKGMITDSAISVFVGENPPARALNLIETTRASLDAGIAKVRDGVEINEISAAIEEVLNQAKLGIVRDLVGHGVGRQLHEEPEIPNYVVKNANGKKKLLEGMTIAIEPMSTLGGDDVTMSSDGWTISTRDSSLSAHFEHTILVTKDGAEVLTRIS